MDLFEALKKPISLEYQFRRDIYDFKDIIHRNSL